MNDFISIAKSINKHCLCKTLDRGQADVSELLVTRPGLFSETALFISKKDLEQMQEIIAAIETVINSDSFKEKILNLYSEFENPLKGVFMGYDFHMTEMGPKLIEINTNAGGAYLNLLLAKAQTACCENVETATDLSQLENKFFAMFRREWELLEKDIPLKTVVIMDETPHEQYLFPEFQLFRDLFKKNGVEAFIAGPEELVYKNNRIWLHDKKIDLIYNRSTDFYFEKDVYAGIKKAFLNKEVGVTPNLYHHAQYANKENLELLTNKDSLEKLGVELTTIETLIKGIPRTVKVSDANRPDLWDNKKKYFFKPTSGYGSKATYRGDKLTSKVWAEMMKGDYVAQELSPPGLRMIEKDGEQFELKNDVRLYTYEGETLIVASRLYSGQTTNFRTAGGGFAAVYII